MRKVIVIILLILGTSMIAMAGDHNHDRKPHQVPEIDLATGTAALALLAGAGMIIRGRRKE